MTGYMLRHCAGLIARASLMVLAAFVIICYLGHGNENRQTGRELTDIHHPRCDSAMLSVSTLVTSSSSPTPLHTPPSMRWMVLAPLFQVK